jgi:putative aldouronate transport system substrate-binding protein
MLKKMFSVVLLVVVFVVSTVGCVNNTNDSTEGTQGDSSQTENDQKDNNSTSEEDYYQLTMAFIANEQEDLELVEEAINELTREELGIEVDLLQLGFGDYADRLRLMLSGSDSLDVFPIFFQQAGTYVNAGQLVDMSDLLESHGQGIIDVLGEDLARVGTVNGFLYGFPAQKESGSPKAVVMRKDLVDKYNIDVESINSLSDMTDVYATIKAGEPGMDMLVGPDTIDRLQLVDNLYDYFGVLADFGQTTEVTNWFEDDVFIEYARLLREWYVDGYVMPDAATSTESASNLVKAGNAFSYVSQTKPGFLVQEERVTGYELEIAQIEEGLLMSSGVNFFNWGIANNSENPEKAMEFLNFAYTNADFMNLINWGIEGVHYEFNDDGTIGHPEGIDATSSTYNLNIGWQLPNQYLCHVWEGNPTDIWERTQAQNDEAVPSMGLGFVPDTSTVANEITALSNVRNQYITALNTGSVDVDSVLEDFNSALYSAGLQKVIDEKQRQLDEWLMSNQ